MIAFRLPAAVAAEIMAHARAEHPLEACGILATDQGGLRHIPMANAEQSATLFAFDPVEQLAVYQKLDDVGEDVVAVWHSHPHSEAFPSARDVAYADPDVTHLIVSLAGELVLRAYRIRDGDVSELPVHHFAERR